ncbi:MULTISPECIES: 16S rRNA (guanine(527)-N(7))-methyltransferase RsmG [Microbacterium]|uniref:16S rRNA (guanine(527)-N(7))-methyltransferase RsmG n=1 Tax=Microbacterium TaxID=33882 RepID=UPI00277E84BE|nr:MULTISPECIES: 16S rRNA (guanine(527)-N(7))-methyltransferase RsmG [Microbacterium]MDQ1082320.1 16S rRNA (guanine527-N7)-methyltransferase [Microbacterium sp. SORGH_AS_0344]MDQ1168909.1 16S rRNA (guanine527-N7)-methyltransferase [Microbacterium proteolyticum]
MPEHLEAEPDAAAQLFGDRIETARRFTANLAAYGEERGLIGPQEVPRLWTRHILNSAIAAPFFTGSAVDVGSGAGLPGLVLAIARPDVEWTLIEPMERRTAWLTEQVADLGLENVSVERMRGEEWARGRVFDVATARAVSALRTLLSFTAPLVRPGGRLVFLKGANVAGEIEAASKQIRKYGLQDVAVEVVGEGLLDEPTRVFLATVTR